MKLKEIILLEQPADFYNELTKLVRILAGYPQGYGFHNSLGNTRGDFIVKDGKGKVHKEKQGKITVYRCVFEPECLLPVNERHDQVLDAVKVSAPSRWRYLPPEKFKIEDEPCYTVIEDGDEIHLLVKHDAQP